MEKVGTGHGLWNRWARRMEQVGTAYGNSRGHGLWNR
jgi:hypothetical protein